MHVCLHWDLYTYICTYIYIYNCFIYSFIYFQILLVSCWKPGSKLSFLEPSFKKTFFLFPCMYAYIEIYIHVYAHTHIYIYIVYFYLGICMCTYGYTYTRAHIHAGDSWPCPWTIAKHLWSYSGSSHRHLNLQPMLNTVVSPRIFSKFRSMPGYWKV